MRTEKQKASRLLQVIAEVYNLSPADIQGKNQTQPIPEARAVFFYLSRQDLKMTCFKSAAFVNRNHSTATQQGNKIHFKRLIYPDLEYKIKTVRDILAPEEFNPYYLMAANLGGYEETKS